jgi:hypothetical protein
MFVITEFTVYTKNVIKSSSQHLVLRILRILRILRFLRRREGQNTYAPNIISKQILSHGLILSYENKQISFVNKFSPPVYYVCLMKMNKYHWETNSLPRFI